jgi:hypothetical protein
VQISATSVDDHLASIDDPTVAETMRAVDRLITDALPGRRRVLYEGRFWGGTAQTIIGYGHIVQSRPGGKEVHWFLIGFARQKNHYTIYVNAVVDGKYLGQHHAGRLGKVKLGSASIGFASLETIELDILTELIRQANEITEPDPD